LAVLFKAFAVDITLQSKNDAQPYDSISFFLDTLLAIRMAVS